MLHYRMYKHARLRRWKFDVPPPILRAFAEVTDVPQCGQSPRAIRVHRVLTVAAWILAIMGRGGFTYASHSGDAARVALREHIAGADADRMQLVRVHQARVTDLQGTISLLEHQLRIASSNPDVTNQECDTGPSRFGPHVSRKRWCSAAEATKDDYGPFAGVPDPVRRPWAAGIRELVLTATSPRRCLRS